MVALALPLSSLSLTKHKCFSSKAKVCRPGPQVRYVVDELRSATLHLWIQRYKLLRVIENLKIENREFLGNLMNLEESGKSQGIFTEIIIGHENCVFLPLRDSGRHLQ